MFVRWTRHSLICVCVLLSPAALGAQGLSVPGAETPFKAAVQNDHRSLRDPAHRESAPLFELPQPAAEEAKALTGSPKGPRLQVGFPRPLTAEARRALHERMRWTDLADGTAGSIIVRSPGAAAARVAFRIGAIPEGVELRFFGVAEDVVYGPIARDELRAAGDGLYWSPVVEGDAVGIELFIPSGRTREEVSVEIVEVSHLLGSVKEGFKRLIDIGSSGFCNIDVACNGAWADAATAVAKMLFTEAGATFVCTGTLMNDQDPATSIPYFLTAEHCIGTQAVASTINFYWFFQRAGCGGANPTSVTQTIGGATLLASDFNLDFSFMRLNNSPPGGVRHAGWSVNQAAVGEGVTGIHHPGGDLKKISHGTVIGFDTWHGAVANTHIEMWWQNGTTESGSSGSALFRNGTWPNQFVIGVLSAGSASCGNPSGSDLYGRFDRAYPAISSYLSPPILKPPLAPVTIAPSGTITNPTPPFSWNAAATATWYHLWVDGAGGNLLRQWYTAAQAGCPSGTGVCTITPAITLPPGAGAFWVQANNSAGTGPWSSARGFTLAPPVAASIQALFPIATTARGNVVRMWGRVLNTGTQPLPAGARVWFYADGPGWAGDHWVGSAAVNGLAPGASNWYSADWAIPGTAMPGTYTYWARVYAGGPISPWSSGQTFGVTAPPALGGTVLSVFPVNGGTVVRGGNAVLWARVANTGATTFPAGSRVWFFVDGPGWTGSHWVGSALVQGLAPGASNWYSYAWPVPLSATPGTYTYWAQVWATGAISPFSTGQPFAVTTMSVFVAPSGVGLENATEFAYSADVTGLTPLSAFNWQFGDGSFSSTVGPIVGHTFTRAGTFQGQVTVATPGGQGYGAASVRVASLVGRWLGTVTGHTAPTPISSFELILRQPLAPSITPLTPISASWSDNAGCRRSDAIFGWVRHPRTVTVGVEHLTCNDFADFYLTGTPDAEAQVISGTCGAGCTFQMTRAS
jgi:lysyl endopeptidase